MELKTDCHFYLGNKPCYFHKKDSRSCKNCKDYKKVEQHILIIKLDALGDVLRTTSILPPIKNKYPNSAVTWITRKNAIPLLQHNPFIHKILCVEDNYLELILAQKFDVCINLDLEILSSSIAKIVQAKEKKGFFVDDTGAVIPANNSALEWFEMSLNDYLKRKNRKTYFEHMYEIIGLSKANIYPPQYNYNSRQKNLIKQKRKEFALYNYRKVLGVNTGGGKKWRYKKWPLQYYIEFCKLVKNKYPDIAIIIYGGPEEIEFNDKIIRALGNQVINGGCTNSLEDFASIISLSDIFLTSDSLGMQLSISQRINTLVIVGPTSPWELEVFGKGEIIFSSMECIGCYLSECNKKPYCMELITPEMVLERLERYL